MSILFVHNYPTSFVQLDMQLLQQHFPVTELYVRSRMQNPVKIFKQVQKHDLVFGWFASWHTFLPILFARILNKPSILVIGGYDLADMPQIRYGNQRGGFRKWVSRATMQLASQLLTNAHYSRKEAEENAGIASERVEVVYHGIPDPFGKLPHKNSGPLVLTVANVWEENLWRKGLEPFVLAASSFPDIPFVLVGAWKDDSINRLKAIAPSNVTFTGWVENETLFDYYRRAHVYVQASAHEGFGMTVAEAMLGGCTPVATRVGALPEVIGEYGVWARSQHPDEVAKAITNALKKGPRNSAPSRQWILSHFSLNRRESALEQMIKTLSDRSEC